METLKPSTVSYIILNFVNKGILHFYITNGLSMDSCSTKKSIQRFFERAFKKNHENAKSSISNFVILNLVKKDILFFHVTTATDICMKEVIDRCLYRAL